MEPHTISTETEDQFAVLQQRISSLLTQCAQLQTEKETLQKQLESLQSKQQALVEEHRQSRTRIDAMVARFNGMELS